MNWNICMANYICGDFKICGNRFFRVMKMYWVFVCLIAFGCTGSPDKSGDATSDLKDTVLHSTAMELYTTYCAGCHGNNMAGGSGGSLLKETWTYGRTRSLIFRNIKFGIEGTDMAGFENILDDGQIGNLVDYLWQAQNETPGNVVEIPEVIETSQYQIQVQQIIADGLEVPWAIEFISDRRALISERKGQLRWLIGGKLDAEPITGTPIPHTGSTTGGFMDIALDPNYLNNGWVYLAYSHSQGNYDDELAPATTRVIRGKIEDHQWVDQQNIFLAADSLWVTEGNRWGSRLLFDDREHLYFSIGDMARAADSQDPAKVSGKIYRIKADGTIPADNPFVRTPGALGAVYSLGNRNVQGFSIHPETREVWFSEHGPMGGDELNILKPNANYGWPVITYGRDYSGEIVSNITHREGMEQPVVQWTPSIGVCPVEFIQGNRFAAWKNNLLVGALALEELQRLVIKDGEVIAREMLLKGVGRVRDIKMAPDGSIYLVLNNPDVLLRLTTEETTG